MMNHALQKKLREISTEQLDQIYMQVFNTDAGRLVLEDLRNRSNFFQPSVLEHHGIKDQITVGFNEGSRAIVLTIESRINPEPKAPERDAGAEPEGEN